GSGDVVAISKALIFDEEEAEALVKEVCWQLPPSDNVHGMFRHGRLLCSRAPDAEFAATINYLLPLTMPRRGGEIWQELRNGDTVSGRVTEMKSQDKKVSSTMSSNRTTEPQEFENEEWLDWEMRLVVEDGKSDSVLLDTDRGEDVWMQKAEVGYTENVEGILEALDGPLSIVHTVSPKEVTQCFKEWVPSLEKEIQQMDLDWWRIAMLASRQMEGGAKYADIEFRRIRTYGDVRGQDIFVFEARGVGREDWLVSGLWDADAIQKEVHARTGPRTTQRARDAYVGAEDQLPAPPRAPDRGSTTQSEADERLQLLRKLARGVKETKDCAAQAGAFTPRPPPADVHVILRYVHEPPEDASIVPGNSCYHVYGDCYSFRHRGTLGRVEQRRICQYCLNRSKEDPDMSADYDRDLQRAQEYERIFNEQLHVSGRSASSAPSDAA
ncbi:unnamed protein product, partial [Symbiodinium sp. KB8]